MINYNEILKMVLESNDKFKLKGRIFEIKDSFLYIYKNKSYIIFITYIENFNRTNISYEYTIYSVNDKAGIDDKSEFYNEIVSTLPILYNLSNDGSKFDFKLKIELSKKIKNIIEIFFDKCNLSIEELEEYKSYLNDMKQMVSPTFKVIYEFFENNYM